MSSNIWPQLLRFIFFCVVKIFFFFSFRVMPADVEENSEEIFNGNAKAGRRRRLTVVIYTLIVYFSQFDM